VPLGFRPEERIRARSDFQKTYRTGQKLFGRFLILFVRPNGFPQLRLGITITKKSGSAVTRNFLRRRLREVFRTEVRAALDFPGREGLDLVVNVRPGSSDQPFQVLRDDFVRLAARLKEKRPHG
jgi:ribonuclease P protein component